jgi:putative redox protein
MSGSLSGAVEWRGGMAFEATSGTGFSLILDSSPELWGSNRGPQPMEMLLLSLAGCTGMSVVSVLRGLRTDVTGYEVRVHGERAETYPKVFTKIAIEHRLWGRDLHPSAVKRAIDLAATKYCAVAATLGETAEIAETWQLVDEDTDEAREG